MLYTDMGEDNWVNKGQTSLNSRPFQTAVGRHHGEAASVAAIMWVGPKEGEKSRVLLNHPWYWNLDSN